MTHVVVFGDLLLDRDTHGVVRRMCPDAPDAPVVDVASVRERPGGAGLAAVLLAASGAEVTLVTAVGRDDAGRRVRALLRPRLRLHVAMESAGTPVKNRIRVAGTSLARLDETQSADPASLDKEFADRELLPILAGADAVLVADYGGDLTRDPRVRAVLTSAAQTLPMVWDPHPRGLPPVPGVAAATPNRGEAAQAWHAAHPAMRGASDQGKGGGALDRSEPVRLIAPGLRARWRAQSLVVTDGARGATVATEDGRVTEVAALEVPGEVDPCGAGDRFAGAVALGLAGGSDVVAAVQRAASTTAAWLAQGGVAGWDVSPVPFDHRREGRDAVLVATGGCFDVLHAGHVELLERARAMGDRLVVLVNSDAGVRRLKGPSRPVNGVVDRVRILRALACVDDVVVFDEDDPSRALNRLRPDIWVKGGDYRDTPLPESATVTGYGGTVRFVSLVPERSTTRLISLLRAETA